METYDNFALELKKILTLPVTNPQDCLYMETVLWRAVVAQTILDALYVVNNRAYFPGSNVRHSFGPGHAASRILYEVEDVWFESVCEYADLPIDKIREYLHKILDGL